MKIVLVRRGLFGLFALAYAMVLALPSPAQVLLLDNFDDTNGPLAAQGDGIVDISTYRPPFGGGGDFVGRTQFRFTLPVENFATTAPGSTDGKVAVLELSTFDSIAEVAGTSFLGTDLITKRNFARGGGLRMTTRMRVDAPTAAQGGMVAAAFMFDVTRGTAPDQVRDEIDHELITNFSSGSAPRDTLTNVWNDGNFASPGAPQVVTNPVGFNVTAFNDYRTDWTPSGVKYYVNDVLVRTETSVVPDDPMRAHWNFWAPDNTFGAAFNAALAPSATGPGTTYRMEIDQVKIERLNTAVSANLLANPSFETLTSVTGGIGGWQLFNNAGFDGIQVEPQQGDVALKVFGPFAGGPNAGASGAYQSVAALPGQEFEGSVFAQAPSFDAIKGNQNYTALTMQFCNAANAVIGSVNFGPGTNQTETPIFDGRDPNMIENEWVQYTVNGVAPAGTAFVRLNVFFIQLANQGGAVWFDNASLVRLTNTAPPENADFNGNGFVDGADFLIWQRNFGSTTPGTSGDANSDGAVDGVDLAIWRNKFGSPAALVATVGVPEPGACLLAAAGLVTVMACRRRPLGKSI